MSDERSEALAGYIATLREKLVLLGMEVQQWHDIADVRSAKLAEAEAEVERLRTLCGEAAEYIRDECTGIITNPDFDCGCTADKLFKRLRAAAAGKETENNA